MATEEHIKEAQCIRSQALSDEEVARTALRNKHLEGLNSRPVIIDRPGWYETRGGSFVHIGTIQDYPDTTPTTRFNCKGTRYAFDGRGKLKRKNWGIWHPSGASQGQGERADDIVRAVPRPTVQEK